jgi:LacI family transcriptional regulator
MKATLQEVAQRAGVSISTVSRALSGRARVDPETRARIRTAMEELDFQPRSDVPEAVAPARTTGMIGFLMPEGMQHLGLNTSIYGAVVGAVRAAAEGAGYAVTVGTYTNGPELVTIGDKLLVHGQLEGAVVYRTRLADENFERFTRLKLPFVVVNRLFERDPFNCVGTNQHYCGELATRHLIELGHTRIAFLGGPSDVASFADRLAGYRQALQQHGIPARSEWEVDCRLDALATRQATQQLLAAPDRPTAIIAANDRTALAIIETIHAAGLRVPQDVSVVGFDDAEESAYVNPPLTTVRLEWAQMAELAAATLVQMLQRRVISRSYIALEPTLIVRQSTAAPS